MARARLVMTLVGAEGLAVRLAGLRGRVRRLAKKELGTIVEHVANRAKEGIQKGPKTGRVYTTLFFTRGEGAGAYAVPYGSRPPHQASAAGEYPASDTGNLMRLVWSAVDDPIGDLGAMSAATALNYDFVDVDVNLTGEVGCEADYAIPLEYKAPSDGGRPFMRRALNESRDFARERFRSLKGRIVHE